jgi:signal transduction histidine kinase
MDTIIRRSLQAVRGTTLVLIATLMACTSLAAEAEQPVQTIAEVLALPFSDGEIARRVRVRGVITAEPQASYRGVRLCIQDDTAAARIRAAPKAMAGGTWGAVQRGTEIDVTGILTPGGYAPLIVAERLTVLGSRPLPEPESVDFDQLFAGGRNGQRVILQGVIQGYRPASGSRTSLIIASESRRFVAKVPPQVLRVAPERLVDSLVNLTGIVSAVRNTRGEFLAPVLDVAEADDIQVLEEAPADPFGCRELPLAGIARFRSTTDRNRRIRTHGIVTGSFAGDVFYLQQGQDGVRVQARAGERVARGDAVEVAGFVDMSLGSGMLCEAICRPLPSGEPLKAIPIQPAKILEANAAARGSKTMASVGTFNGCLIEFTGKHVESERPIGGWCRMTVMDGATAVTALLPEEAFESISRIQSGSLLRCTGIADVKTSFVTVLPLDQDPVSDRVDVLIQTAADVAVVSVPSWWTPQRMRYALAAAALMIAAAMVVIQILRRRIMAQATRLAEQIRSARDAAVEHETALRERTRLASNLHDTVLQTVTGIGFQLRACRTAGDHDTESVTSHVHFAERMVEHAVQQLRGTVWALHTIPAEGPSFADALQNLADRLESEHAVRIDVRAEGQEQGVPEAVAGNLLLVVKEAIHNAVRHGHASMVDVKVTYAREGGISLVIRDDGVGFEPGNCPGSADGHFGLEGMRDRLLRMGGSLEVSSMPGEGTRVRATVPAACLPAPVLEDSI